MINAQLQFQADLLYCVHTCSSSVPAGIKPAGYFFIYLIVDTLDVIGVRKVTAAAINRPKFPLNSQK
jgi:hypothetical protein